MNATKDWKERAAPRVFAVIVAYNPDAAKFPAVLRFAAQQADHVVVVDNAKGAGLGFVIWSEQLKRIDMNGNVGVARAQNAGMQYAFEHGASHVLLLDDDSLLGAGASQHLMSVWREKSQAGINVAAVGPQYLNVDGAEESPFVVISGLQRSRADLHAGPIVEASYLISSGSLISREAFEAVGPMDEGLFIDYVDIEWGLRARGKGWKCFGAVGASMDHCMGDAPLVILGNKYPFHSPTRHYYMFRNGLSLILRSDLPRGWKIREVWLLLRRAVAYCLFAPTPRPHALAILYGIVDAFKGRVGQRAQT